MSQVTAAAGVGRRARVGAWAWVASAAILPVQLVVALRWPAEYSWRDNAISDLGVTVCGEFAEQAGMVRDVCSPWHAVFNSGLVGSGALLLVGAVLLHGWWGGRSGRAGTVLMGLAGACVVGVGLAPWDVSPGLHDGAALGQALAQWLAMALLALAAGPGAFRRVTVAVILLSVAGLVAFLAAASGQPVPVLGFGLAERLSFDTLTLWPAVVGAALLAGRLSSRQSVSVTQRTVTSARP